MTHNELALAAKRVLKTGKRESVGNGMELVRVTDGDDMTRINLQFVGRPDEVIRWQYGDNLKSRTPLAGTIFVYQAYEQLVKTGSIIEL